MLNEIIERWETRINYYNLTDSIDVDIDEDAELHLRKMAINKGTKENLIQEMEYLSGLRDQYK